MLRYSEIQGIAKITKQNHGVVSSLYYKDVMVKERDVRNKEKMFTCSELVVNLKGNTL